MAIANGNHLILCGIKGGLLLVFIIIYYTLEDQETGGKKARETSAQPSTQTGFRV